MTDHTNPITDEDLQAIPDSVAEVLFAFLDRPTGTLPVPKWEAAVDDIADRLAALRRPRFQPGDAVWVDHEVLRVDSDGTLWFDFVGGLHHESTSVRSAADFVPTPPPEVLEWARHRCAKFDRGEWTSDVDIAQWIINTHGEKP